MTANHHADERGESTRLRRVGGGLVIDSFGDTRWMGSLTNTRGCGHINRFDGNLTSVLASETCGTSLSVLPLSQKYEHKSSVEKLSRR